VTLADGCPLKGREICWTMTMDEALPYLEHRRRQLLFRECVLSFFGVPPLGTADRDDDDYAAAVRMKEQAHGH